MHEPTTSHHPAGDQHQQAHQTGPSFQELLGALQQMDPYDFEYLLGDLWAVEGFDTLVTEGSGDQGIDVYARTDPPGKQEVAIQAKRYKHDNSVGGPTVRRCAGLYATKGVDNVVVVTTSEFTTEAHSEAQQGGVELVNGAQLADQILQRPDYQRVVQQYFPHLWGRATGQGADDSTDPRPHGGPTPLGRLSYGHLMWALGLFTVIWLAGFGFFAYRTAIVGVTEDFTATDATVSAVMLGATVGIGMAIARAGSGLKHWSTDKGRLWGFFDTRAKLVGVALGVGIPLTVLVPPVGAVIFLSTPLIGLLYAYRCRTARRRQPS